MKSMEQTLIEAGRPYTIAAASGNVVEYVPNPDGAELRLTRTEFDILAALMRGPSRVFTKQALFAIFFGVIDASFKVVNYRN